MHSLNTLGLSAEPASLTTSAAAVPNRPASPQLLNATNAILMVKWSAPDFNGGSALTGWEIRRDNGTGTAFQSEIAISDPNQLNYTF